MAGNYGSRDVIPLEDPRKIESHSREAQFPQFRQHFEKPAESAGAESEPSIDQTRNHGDNSAAMETQNFRENSPNTETNHFRSRETEIADYEKRRTCKCRPTIDGCDDIGAERESPERNGSPERERYFRG